MPTISVIVPVYNAENYLNCCVDSILAQTFTDIEVLLVDDGSQDGSGAICDEYAKQDSRIRVFHKKNGGVSSARNLGLEHSRGEYIMFADSDDVVDIMWVENLLKTMTSTKTDLSICSYVIRNLPSCAEKMITYHNGTCCIKKREEVLDFWNAFLLNRNHMVLSLWNKIFRRNIVNEQGLRFDESLSHSEDALFVFAYLRCTKCGISISNTVGYYYLKRNEETLTSKYKPDYWAVKKRGFSELLETIIQNEIMWNEIEKSFATHINTVVLVAINNVLMINDNYFKKMHPLGKEILNSQECRWGMKNADFVDVHWLYRYVLKTRSFHMIFLFHKVVMLKNFRKK